MAFPLPVLRQSVISASRLSGKPSVSIPSLVRARAMASAPRKFEFLVVVHDLPGKLEKRLEVRAQHFAGLTPHLESGAMKTGGAILHSVPKDDEASSLDFAGSTLVIEAESKEAVLEHLKKDIYARSGVWDMENVQIWPFTCAFRKPL